MSVLFLSHSSRDDDLATQLDTWFANNGFDDIFIDNKSILAGDKWPEALRQASGTCRVVACLVTEHWLNSDECFSEFRAAWYMGKRIIPMLAYSSPVGHQRAQSRLEQILKEDQGVNIQTCISDDRYLSFASHPEIEERLRAGLLAAGAQTKIGLDPSYFPINKNIRPMPFPGLSSFGDDDADAALFYGRSHEIAECLEELRKMRAEADRRPLVILGASGSGKSSLLKAGLIPRLRRETPAWIPLRAFRPGANALYNFADAIARTMQDYQKTVAAGNIRDRLRSAWEVGRNQTGNDESVGDEIVERALQFEADALRQAAGKPGATILINVDQAEELIRQDSEGADILTQYLRHALTSKGIWQIVFTIRSDAFAEFQSSPRLQSLNARGYDLRSLPSFRFDSVVEDPAKRYGVRVGGDLVQSLMRDAPKEDSLPLLAFTLQTLWRQYSATGLLTNAQYESVGRTTGLIENAAESALRGIEPGDDRPVASLSPQSALETLGRKTFVPSLAQLNEEGRVISRTAQWRGFSTESKELLERFERWRLVARRSGPLDSQTVEVTHETLFREWKRLARWLEPEKERLETLRSLRSSALVWDRNDRSSDWLDHRGERLRRLRNVTGDLRYVDGLSEVELSYTNAASRLDIRQKRIRRSMVAILVVTAMGSAVVWDARESLVSFEQNAESRVRAVESGNPDERRTAFGYAFAAATAPMNNLLSRSVGCRIGVRDARKSECMLRQIGYIEAETTLDDFGQSQYGVEVQDWLFLYGKAARVYAKEGEPLGKVLFPQSTSMIAVNAKKAIIAAVRQDVVQIINFDGIEVQKLRFGLDELAYTADFSPDGASLAVAYGRRSETHGGAIRSGGVRIYDTVDWNQQTAEVHTRSARLVDYNNDGTLFATGSDDQSVSVLDAKSLNVIKRLPHRGGLLQISFIREGKSLLTRSDDNVVRIFDSADWSERVFDRNQTVRAGQISYDGRWLVTIEDTVRIIPIGNDSKEKEIALNAAAISFDATTGYLAIGHDREVSIWNIETMREVTRLGGFENKVGFVQYLSDSRLLVIAEDKPSRIVSMEEVGNYGGNELVNFLCASNRRKEDIFRFNKEELNNDQKLRGRPADVCEWRQLGSWAGWKQLGGRWLYKLAGIDLYEPE